MLVFSIFIRTFAIESVSKNKEYEFNNWQKTRGEGVDPSL